MSYNAYALKSMLNKDHVYNILDQIGSKDIKSDSNGFRSSCPIHDSNSNNVFVYNPDVNLYCCYGECNYNEKDGDIIKLVQICQKCNFDEAIELICEWSNIDINIIENNDEYIIEEIKNKLDSLLSIYEDNKEEEEYYYGVKPLEEDILIKFLGKKDEEGFIDSQGFRKNTLEIFESGYNEKEKRWLLPQRSEDGLLLGFDGRDTTNKDKSKWKKRKGLLSNKILGRLDITLPYIIKESKIILCEGKKDQMAFYEADLKHCSCLYGSSLSYFQHEIIIKYVEDEIIICPDGDSAGYKMVQSILKAYPEFDINVLEIEDGEDAAELSSKSLKLLYDNRINIEEWLKIYKYRSKKQKK